MMAEKDITSKDLKIYYARYKEESDDKINWNFVLWYVLSTSKNGEISETQTNIYASSN